MFKIGEKVRVINTGKQYARYLDFIEKYCPREKASKFYSGYECEKNVLALVIGCGEHLTEGGTPKIYILEYDNHVVIIGESGLERASETKSIHIYTNDLTTTAVIKENGKVIKSAVAKCSPSDTYDFEVGAKLAFERLLDNGVKEVKRPAKVGEYIKIVDSDGSSYNDYKNGDILLVVKADKDKTSSFAKNVAFYKNGLYKYAKLEEYVVLENYKPTEKAEFKPHLLCTKCNKVLGNIGEETIHKDKFGKEINIGDVIFSICKNKLSVIIKNKCCRGSNEYESDVVLVKKYGEIKNGEIIDDIQYIQGIKEEK